MATGKRGGGPGSYTENGVNRTMHAPFGKAANSYRGSSPGIDGHNRAPLDKPQDLGGGGIPTRFFDGLPTKRAATTSSAGASSVIGITKRNIGDRRFKNTK